MQSNSVFLKEFLMLSEVKTLLFLILLFGFFTLMWHLQKRKVNFGSRVLLGMLFGFIIGIIIQFVSNFPTVPDSISFINETTTWYSLFGNGYMSLIRMLVIPLVIISIIHVIINMKEDAKIGKLVRNSIIVTMGMVALSAVIGIVTGVLFKIGSNVAVANGEEVIKEVTPIVTTLKNLIPSNPVQSMVDLNVIALVIFSVFIAIGARRMNKKYGDIIKPFYDLINSLHKIIISIAMSIIKFMPFAVIPLLANTIALRGIQSIMDMIWFIVALYAGIIIMFLIQLTFLSFLGLNPLTYLKKSIPVLTLAFTSRSSVGSLPATIDTLSNKLGVNDGTAGFVASFGTTAGMQGCAGVFPALLVVFVSNLEGIPIDFTMIFTAIIVITIGSLGIAGIPGTATMAASVSLSGTGLAQFFPMISPILAIDPLIDMARTFLNVSGSMVNAIIVDKSLKQLNKENYDNMSLK